MKETRFCADCGKQLKGHGNPVRCGSCACKISRKNRRPNRFNSVCPKVAGPNHPNWKGGNIKYRGDGWIRARRLVLQRDNRTCVKCGKSHGKIDVDHIKGKDETGGEWNNDLSNLQTLCTSCHAKKTGLGGLVESERQCVTCGRTFIGKAGNAKSCSAECKAKRKNEMKKLRTS